MLNISVYNIQHMHGACRVFIQACSNICRHQFTAKARFLLYSYMLAVIYCKHQFTAERQCVQQMHKCMIIAVCLYRLAVIFATAERQCVQQMHKCMILAVCLYTLAVIFAGTNSLLNDSAYSKCTNA